MLIHKYSFEKTMDELQKYNKCFILFEDIKLIYQEICDLIKESSFLEEKKDKLLLIVPVNMR